MIVSISAEVTMAFNIILAFYFKELKKQLNSATVKTSCSFNMVVAKRSYRFRNRNKMLLIQMRNVLSSSSNKQKSCGLVISKI